MPSHGGTVETVHRVTVRNVQGLKPEQQSCHSGLVKDSHVECDWVCGRILRCLRQIAHPQPPTETCAL